MSYTPWTIDEDVQLLEELDNGVKLAEIAISHHRSEGAITSRCRHIATELYQKGATINELMRLCRLTERGVVLALRNRGLMDTEDIEKLKTYIYNELTGGGVRPNPGISYNPFLGHHYFFKISHPLESDQKDAAFLHNYIGEYGHLRFSEITSLTIKDFRSHILNVSPQAR